MNLEVEGMLTYDYVCTGTPNVIRGLAMNGNN